MILDFTQAIEIAPKIFWIGSYLENDPFQCHPYLIENGNESILLDPGSMLEFDSLITKARTVTELKNIKYIILHHQDPDLCASISEIEKLIDRDDLQIITHSRMTALIKHYLTTSAYYEIDQHDHRLVTQSGLNLEFITTPYCHSPGAFVTFEKQSHILFSSDIFGGLEESWEFYATEKYFDQARAFHESYMPGKDIFNYTLRKIEQLDITLIAPQHGSIIKKEYIPKLIENMKNLECGLYIDRKYNDELLDVIKQLEQSKLELKKQEQFLQQVINGSADQVMVINCDYTISLMNDMAKDAVNLDYVGDNENPKCYEVLHHHAMPCDGSSEPCPMKMIMENKQSIQVTHKHVAKNGDSKFIELSANPLMDDNGDIFAIIESAHDVTMHWKIHRKLSEQKRVSDHKANHDHLTGLPTRALLMDRLQQAIKSAKRHNNRVGVLFIDLDNFKPINDQLGHQAGDHVLKTVAHRFKKILRQVDTIARVGGDEFIIVFNSLKHRQDVVEVVDKLIESINKSIVINDSKVNITTSIGISIYPDDGSEIDILLKNADLAMYKAKEMGRDTYHFFNVEH